MKKVFYVTYDARNGDDAEPLKAELKKFNGKRILESVWTIKVDDKYDSEEVLKHLKKFIGDNTGIVVIEPIDHYFYHLDEDPHDIYL